MNLGILGGTFDPPHIAHLIVAQDAFVALGLDRLLLVPAAEPPHKRGRVATPAALRLEMLRAAVADDPRFTVDALEIRRGGPSYTVETLREIREREGDVRLFLLLGGDQILEFHTWREHVDVARMANITVLSRGGVTVDYVPARVQWRTVAVTSIALASSDVRQRVAEGLPIRYLVPEAVERIIRREGLYTR